jgi:hypothetical protein
MGKNDDETEIVNRRFKRVFREIEYLGDKIYKQKGLLFKAHVHTIDELLNSQHHRNIFFMDRKNW